MYGAKNDDDLLENYCIEIYGYKFLEPRFYFHTNKINDNILHSVEKNPLILIFINREEKINKFLKV